MARRSTRTTGKSPAAGNYTAFTTTLSLLAVCFFLSLAGCASAPNSDVLVDPLKQRLIAREDIALQNLLLDRMPAYSVGGSGSDEPYSGPSIEPPLPDLNLLPEDMPPWEELPPLSIGEDAAPAPDPAPVVAAPSPEAATLESAAQ